MENKIKRVFEIWVLNQFGDGIKPMLSQFDEDDGYTADPLINGMWIGFNAGAAFQQQGLISV